MQIIIPHPMTPAADPMPLLESRIFDKEINIYMKRRSTLDENVQKSYSLVLGQCTDLLAEYVGAESKYGGDICSTLENEVRITIPQPVTPTGDPMPLLESRIFDKEINIYMKRRSTLDENV